MSSKNVALYVVLVVDSPWTFKDMIEPKSLQIISVELKFCQHFSSHLLMSSVENMKSCLWISPGLEENGLICRCGPVLCGKDNQHEEQ